MCDTLFSYWGCGKFSYKIGNKFMELLGALGDTWACMYYGLKLASYMVVALESFTIVCLYREAILFAIIVVIIIMLCPCPI